VSDQSNAINGVYSFLTPDLCTTLASLHGAPRSVAEATVQLLPFGSRAALESTDPPLAVAAGGGSRDGEHRRLELTPLAYQVMAYAAAAADADPAGVDEWTHRAQIAASAAAAKAAARKP